MHARSCLVVALAGLVGACSTDPAVARRRHFEKANGYFAEGKYQEAIVEYRGAVQADPKSGEARFKLAETYEKVADPNNALREYVRAADLLPDDAQAQLKAGGYLLLARQYQDAQTRANTVLKKNPSSVDAQILLGTALAGLKDIEGAIAEIEEAIRLDPDRSNSYTALAVLQLSKGQRKDAEAAFAKALESDPKSIKAHLALANYKWSIRDRAGAEQYLKRASEIEPDHVVVNRALATFYVATGRAPQAERHLKAIANATDEPAPRLMLADYYAQIGRLKDASVVLQPLTTDKRVGADVNVRLASIAYLEKRTTEAHRIVDALIEQDPGDADALVAKGRFLLAEKRPDEALTNLKAAVDADPTSAVAHYVLGSLYADMSDYEQATKHLNEVLKLNPRAVDAQLQLSRVYLNQGQAAAAVQFANQAVRIQPQNVLAHLVRARSLMARVDLMAAETEMRALVAAVPDAPEVHAQMGTLHLLKKDTPSARRAFERALQIDPRNAEALSGLSSIDIAGGRTSDAIARVEAALTTAGQDAKLLLVAARVYSAVRDREKEADALRRAIDAEPDNLEAYSRLGELYIALNRLDEARARFEALAQRQPTSVTAPTMVALILEYQNKPDEAQRQYQEVLNINPRAAVAANNLAWMLAERGGNLDVALELASTAKRGLPAEPDVNDTLGWIYYKKNLPQLAVVPLQESVASAPQNPLFHYHLGLTYAKLGDKAKARRALERALALDKTFSAAADARSVLATLEG